MLIIVYKIYKIIKVHTFLILMSYLEILLLIIIVVRIDQKSIDLFYLVIVK